MRILIDTHAFLWWASDRGARLSNRGRDLLSDGATEVAISVASVWEIAIKVGGGRMVLPESSSATFPIDFDTTGSN